MNLFRKLPIIVAFAALLCASVFAIEGTYVPENNFTVTVGVRAKLPQAFGVTFPDIRLSITQVNVPANNAVDASAAVVKAINNLTYTIDPETNVATPNGITLTIDSITSVRQDGPVEDAP